MFNVNIVKNRVADTFNEVARDKDYKDLAHAVMTSMQAINSTFFLRGHDVIAERLFVSLSDSRRINKDLTLMYQVKKEDVNQDKEIFFELTYKKLNQFNNQWFLFEDKEHYYFTLNNSLK